MVLKQEAILERLKQLDAVFEELSRYRGKSEEEISASLSLRWIIERGLITAATLIFDVADHILSAHFGVYSETYEDLLWSLNSEGVISEKLYQEIKGLGGFRNILVHDYLRVDIAELLRHFEKAFHVFLQFSLEIQEWLDKLDTDLPK